MNRFTKLSLRMISDLEQLETALRNGDTSQEPFARELLKLFIDASNAPVLAWWIKAVGMVGSAAVEKHNEEAD